MRLFEIIQIRESMTMWIPDAPSKEIKHTCNMCDGAGEFSADDHRGPGPCFICNQTGYWTDHQSTAPEMNLSNVNAIAAMVALGYEEDYGYKIIPEEIPALKQKIMMLLNKEGALDAHTTPVTDDQKDFGMVRSKDPETGIDKIERKKGARMIGPGRDVGYLSNVFERMLLVLDYAQKHNMEISFA